MKENWQVPAHQIEEFQIKRSRYAVIPVIWNEGEKIKKQLARMQGLSDVDILLADNGSNDGSTDSAILKSFNVRALISTQERGYGCALRAAMSYALEQGYEGVITIDGNGKDGVEAVADFVKCLDDGYDFIQASRFMKGGLHKNTPMDRFLGIKLIMVPLFALASGFYYTDPANGFRAYSKRLLLDARVQAFRDVFKDYRFQYFISKAAPRLGYKVREIPAARVYPDSGQVPTKILGIVPKLTILGQMIAACLGIYDAKQD